MGENVRTFVVGLGNPGKKYAANRHNLGFIVLDLLATRLEKIWVRTPTAHILDASLGGRKLTLIKPQTYMNRSGGPVREKFVAACGKPVDLIVVHDDLDVASMRLKIKVGGGAGGHNGIKSVIECCETADFVRVKVGVGRPPEGMEVADYVLSDFGSDEAGEVQKLVKKAANAVEAIILEGPERAMNCFNSS